MGLVFAGRGWVVFAVETVCSDGLLTTEVVGWTTGGSRLTGGHPRAVWGRGAAESLWLWQTALKMCC